MKKVLVDEISKFRPVDLGKDLSSFAKVFNLYSTKNLSSTFSTTLSTIEESFLESLPVEFKNLLGEKIDTVNNFYIFPNSDILVLCYTTSSITELRLYEKALDISGTTRNVSEDSLQALIVDEDKDRVFTSAGLFETKVFIFTVKDLTPLMNIDTNGPVKFLCYSLARNSFVTLLNDSDTVEWDLENLGKSWVLTNENYEWMGAGVKMGGIFLATSYGKITCFVGRNKIEIKEPMKVKKIAVSEQGDFLVIDNSKEITVFEVKEVFEKKMNYKFDTLIRGFFFCRQEVLVVYLFNGLIFLFDVRVSRSPIRINVDKSMITKYMNEQLFVLVDKKIFSVKFPYMPKMFEITQCSFTALSVDNKCAYVKKKTEVNILDIHSGVHRHLITCPSDIQKLLYIDELKLIIWTSLKVFIIDVSNSQVLLEKDKDDENIIFTKIDYGKNLLYTSGNKKKVKVFELSTLEKIKEIGNSVTTIISFAPFSDWSHLVTREEVFIRLFNIATNEETLCLEERCQSFCLSPDNFTIFLSKQGFFKIFDLRSNSFTHECLHNGVFNFGLYLTFDSSFLMALSSDSFLRFWDYQTLTLVFEIPIEGAPDFLKVTDDENYLLIRTDIKFKSILIMKNPLKETEVSIQGNINNVFGFMRYFIEAKQKKLLNYQKEFDKSVIMPYKLTFSHIFAMKNLSQHLKSSLIYNPVFSKSSSNVTILDLSLELDNRSSSIVILRYLTKNLKKYPFIPQSISQDNLIAINLSGFECIVAFYDSLLYTNPYTSLPQTISSSFSLPKTKGSNLFVPKVELFDIKPESLSGSVNVEFVSTLVKLNLAFGSTESINFLSSILKSPQQDIFRSKFVQLYINSKWKYHLIAAGIELSIFIFYMGLLFTISLQSSSSLNVYVAFFVFGFTLALYESLQILGGVKIYFQGIWNFIDLIRTVFLILFIDCLIYDKSYKSTMILILNIISLIRGISYFRVFSKTRYMINLITEVVKDVIPFLLILTYSTIGFSFILMRSADEYNSLSDNIIGSYMITLGSISSPSYNATQWVCFVFCTLIDSIIMMNLLISIMGDTHDRVQEGKDVADYQELTSLVFEVEAASVLRRDNIFHGYFHVIQEATTKGQVLTWLGKVREIKLMISSMKQGQSKIFESNQQLLEENHKLKEQMSRIEKILTGIKEKINSESNEAEENEVSCEKGHRLVITYHYDSMIQCFKCSKLHEILFSCGKCNYFLCKNCFKIYLREKVMVSEFRCYRDHKLTWLADQEKYKNKLKVFRCVGCKKRMFKNSFNCEKCSWDICRKCVEIIFTKSSIAWSVHCFQNHPLAWRQKGFATFKCNTCLNVFRNVGSYKCDNCDYDACIRCFSLMVENK